MNFLYKISPSKSTFEHDYWGASLKELIYDKILSKEWYNSSLHTTVRKIVNVGRISCHLGHLEIMRRFLNTNYN